MISFNNNNNINDNKNFNPFDMGSFFNPLTENNNFQILNYFNNNMDLKTLILVYGGFNITVDCIFNQDILETMKKILLKKKRYLDGIKLKEYYINNLDHALIYFLNILNSNPKDSDKYIIHSIKNDIKKEKPKSIIDLILLVQKYSISSMSYYFGEYYIYNLLLLVDFDFINTKINFQTYGEFKFVYSPPITQFKDTIFKNFESKWVSSINEKDISDFNSNKEKEKSWLLIFKTIIICISPQYLKYFLESSKIAKKKYIFLIKNYFFDMIIYHIDLNNPNDQNKINILFDYLEMDESEKSTFISSIYDSISGICEKNKINSLEEVINYLFCLSNYKKLPYFLYDAIVYIINNLQFQKLPKLLSVYRNIDKKLYNTILNKKNDPFFQFKSNLLLIPLLNSIKSMNKQSVVDILNTVLNNNPFDIVNKNKINETNNIFVDQNYFFYLNELNNFNQTNVIIPETVNDSISLIRHLLFNGFLIEFDLNQFFVEIFSNNRFNKMEIILILVCDEFKESNYTYQFNFKVLNEKILNSKELLYLHTISDQLQKDQLFSNKTNYLNEFDFYDESDSNYDEETEDENNENSSDEEKGYKDNKEYQVNKENELDTPYTDEKIDNEKGKELYKQYMIEIEKEFIDLDSLFKQSKKSNENIKRILIEWSLLEGNESSESS